jgi:hypothetical protein
MNAEYYHHVHQFRDVPMNLMKGQQLIPLEEKTCNLGEMYQYDFEKFIRFTLIVFQLVDLAQRESVEMCITLDGAELCDGISHLTAGIKVTDPWAIDPRDGSPLCLTMFRTMGVFLTIRVETTASPCRV